MPTSRVQINEVLCPGKVVSPTISVRLFTAVATAADPSKETKSSIPRDVVQTNALFGAASGNLGKLKPTTVPSSLISVALLHQSLARAPKSCMGSPCNHLKARSRLSPGVLPGTLQLPPTTSSRLFSACALLDSRRLFRPHADHQKLSRRLLWRRHSGAKYPQLDLYHLCQPPNLRRSGNSSKGLASSPQLQAIEGCHQFYCFAQ